MRGFCNSNVFTIRLDLFKKKVKFKKRSFHHLRISITCIPTMKHHLSRSRHSRPRSRAVAPAFTLVEMLVVITIITVLLTIGAVGLKDLTKASGVSAGLPVAEAVFAEARALAIGEGTKARVLIHGTQDNDDEYHRERVYTAPGRAKQKQHGPYKALYTHDKRKRY